MHLLCPVRRFRFSMPPQERLSLDHPPIRQFLRLRELPSVHPASDPQDGVTSVGPEAGFFSLAEPEAGFFSLAEPDPVLEPELEPQPEQYVVFGLRQLLVQVWFRYCQLVSSPHRMQSQIHCYRLVWQVFSVKRVTLGRRLGTIPGDSCRLDWGLCPLRRALFCLRQVLWTWGLEPTSFPRQSDRARSRYPRFLRISFWGFWGHGPRCWNSKMSSRRWEHLESCRGGILQ